MQWRNEIQAHTTDGMKVLVWHGSNRENNVKELSKYDVVLTTVGSSICNHHYIECQAEGSFIVCGDGELLQETALWFQEEGYDCEREECFARYGMAENHRQFCSIIVFLHLSLT